MEEPSLLAAKFKAGGKINDKKKKSGKQRYESTIANPGREGGDTGIPPLNGKGSEECDCKQIEAGVWIGKDCVLLDSPGDGMVDGDAMGCPP